MFVEKFAEAVHRQDPLGIALAVQNINDINARYQPELEGHTFLTYTIEYGTLFLVQMVVELGADVRTSCFKGKTPMYYAVRNGDAETVRFLFNQGASPHSDPTGTSALWVVAAHSDNVDVYKALIEHGADVNHQDNDGWTPLHHAVLHGGVNCCKVLIDAGAALDVRVNPGGMTPLYSSVLRYKKEVLQLLVDEGANVDIPDSVKETPLHLAARRGYEDICKILIEAGAYVNNVDGTKSTPLHLAAKFGDKNISQMLISAGADVNLKDKEGKSPWHICDYGEIGAMLKNAGARRGIRYCIKNFFFPTTI